MLKPKASWKGLDRSFCCPVTCTQLYNIVLSLYNLNGLWSLIVAILSYISFAISCVNTLCTLLIQCSIWYIILIIVSFT